MRFYDFSAKTMSGNEIKMDHYKGKVVLIVNTASKCGFTPQYEDLQKLYNLYNSKGFEILAFPCNQFMEQEPGTNEDIKSFCSLNYGVTFPIFEKVEVNGDAAHPLFKYLTENAPFKGFDMHNGTNKILEAMLKEKYPEFTIGNAIRWNFTKFLIDQDGNIVERFESSVNPMDIASNLEKIL